MCTKVLVYTVHCTDTIICHIYYKYTREPAKRGIRGNMQEKQAEEESPYQIYLLLLLHQFVQGWRGGGKHHEYVHSFDALSWLKSKKKTIFLIQEKSNTQNGKQRRQTDRKRDFAEKYVDGEHIPFFDFFFFAFAFVGCVDLFSSAFSPTTFRSIQKRP